jgi:hypothetical protein
MNYLISIITCTSTAPQNNTGLYSESVASQGIMSKWFYDTFTDAATGAARCGSFIGERFGLLVTSYGWTQWTWRFMWFEPPKRNTLRPRENWVVLLKPVLSKPAFLSAPVEWHLPKPFIAQGWAVTMSPEARQVALRWLKPYTAAGVLMARSSKWCLVWRQQCGAILSYHSAVLSMACPVEPSCRVISHYSHIQEWPAGPTLHCRDTL